MIFPFFFSLNCKSKSIPAIVAAIRTRTRDGNRFCFLGEKAAIKEAERYLLALNFNRAIKRREIHLSLSFRWITESYVRVTAKEFPEICQGKNTGWWPFLMQPHEESLVNRE